MSKAPKAASSKPVSATCLEERYVYAYYFDRAVERALADGVPSFATGAAKFAASCVEELRAKNAIRAAANIARSHNGVQQTLTQTLP